MTYREHPEPDVPLVCETVPDREAVEDIGAAMLELGALPFVSVRTGPGGWVVEARPVRQIPSLRVEDASLPVALATALQEARRMLPWGGVVRRASEMGEVMYGDGWLWGASHGNHAMAVKAPHIPGVRAPWPAFVDSFWSYAGQDVDTTAAVDTKALRSLLARPVRREFPGEAFDVLRFETALAGASLVLRVSGEGASLAVPVVGAMRRPLHFQTAYLLRALADAEGEVRLDTIDKGETPALVLRREGSEVHVIAALRPEVEA